MPDLASYFDKHPNSSDPEAPLWIAMDEKKFGKPWSYAAMRKRLQRICDIAQIHKRVWPNLFRHTGATKTGMFLTESLQKKRYGWSSGSKMPDRYEHMMNSDVEEAIFKHYGISNNKNDDIVSRPKMCHICNISNSHDAKICSKCGKPLSLEASIEKEEQEKKEREQFEEKIKQVDELLEKQKELTVTRLQEEFFARKMQKDYQKIQDEMITMRAELNAFRKDKK